MNATYNLHASRAEELQKEWLGKNYDDDTNQKLH